MMLPEASDGSGGGGTGPREAGFGSVEMKVDRSVPGVFVARVSGQGGDADAAARRWRHLVEEARAYGKTNLMVARDLDGPVLSQAALSRMIAQLADLDLHGLRIALVQPRHERQRIDELGALMAMERGGMIRVFADETAALMWLRYGSHDDARNGEE
jgi:hypothetical protein